MTGASADQACVVTTALGTEDEADSLAAALVEAGLAACVQVVHVRSFYRWEGELRREPEWLLLIKTRSARFSEVEAFIRGRHSYELPEVLQLPVAGGAPDYLRWLLDATATGGAKPRQA
ncbi:MAG: divalent-cation tolerance protein CutA [Proteobacteria bacterium]|nr:divalent-cation tolerance protein CutA [Pseudomonadota bacterium]